MPDDRLVLSNIQQSADGFKIVTPPEFPSLKNIYRFEPRTTGGHLMADHYYFAEWDLPEGLDQNSTNAGSPRASTVTFALRRAQYLRTLYADQQSPAKAAFEPGKATEIHEPSHYLRE